MLPMMTQTAGIEGLIFTAIVMLFVVGSKIAKATQSDSDSENGSSKNRTPEQNAQRQARLEELAAKRRAELQRMAQEGQSGRTPPTQVQSQPRNMNMGQASQREEAKALYEKRAAALRQKQKEQQRHTAPATQPYSQTPAVPGQSQSEHELSKVRQREEQLARQRQAAQHQRELQQRKHLEELGRGATAVSHQKHGDIETVHRHVTDANINMKPKQAKKINALGGMPIDRSAMRKALIMKEILDLPVALRKEHL